MGYDNLHNITSKQQHVMQEGIQFDGILKAGYDLDYTYSSEKPHQIASVKDADYRTEDDAAKETVNRDHAYQYDANGNLIYINTAREKQDGAKEDGANERKMLWGEENRLGAINVNGFISGYWYDAGGERVIKTSGDDEGMYVNDVFSGARTETNNFTAYINPYLVVSKGGQYTKHIYIGSQRIVSKLGDLDSYGQDPRRVEYAGANVEGAKVDYAAKYKESQQTIKDNYAYFEVDYNGTDNDDYVNGGGFCCDDNPLTRSFIPQANDNPELFQYYYHADHLGSSSLITNLDGEVVQHIEYVPFGEVFIEERNNKWNTPYLFNAKELDEETGLYYYGARYYDSRVSVWLSTDPMAEKYPNKTPYHYCSQNPVNMIDPDGMDDIFYDQEGRETNRTIKDGAHSYFMQHNDGNIKIENNNYYQGNSYDSFFGDRSDPGIFNQVDATTIKDGDAISTIVDSHTPTDETWANFGSESRSDHKYDYKNSVLSADGGEDNARTAYMIKGILFNRNEAGNVLWGATTSKLGMTDELVWIGSQGFTLIAERQADEVGEQNAIYTGRSLYGTRIQNNLPSLWDYIVNGKRATITYKSGTGYGSLYQNRDFIGNPHRGDDPTKK